MSGEIEWRWADPQGQQRLVRIDELRAALAGGVIAPNTPVWRSGWGAWKPAYEVPELGSSAAANGAVLNIPPPPLFIVAVQHEYEDKGAPPDPPASHDEPPPPPHYVPGAAPPVESSQNQVVLFPAVPSPPPASPPSPRPPPASAGPALPQPATLVGFAPSSSPPPSLPHSAMPSPAARASSFPPDDSSWDDAAEVVAEKGSDQGPPSKPGSAKRIPAAAPSETLAGARPPMPAGSDANTGVDISKLTPDDAERILAGGSGLRTVVGVPVLAEPALPPPPPLRPSSLPPTLAQAGGNIRTPAFASAAPTASSPPRQPSGKSTGPPPLRRRGQTLMLYGGAPQEAEAPDAKPSDAPPIKVPAPGVQAPKAVTQAPPWLGDAKSSPTVPKLPPSAVPQIRPMMDSIEEISGSVILAEDSGADVTARRQKIEDLSGSHVLPDASGPAPQIPPPSIFEASSPSQTLHAEPAPPPPVTTAGPDSVAPTAPAGGYVPAPGTAASDDDSSIEPRSPLASASPSHRNVHDLNDVWSAQRKRRLFAMGAGGAFFLLGSIVLVVKLASGGPSAEEPQTVTVAHPAAPTTTPTAPVPAPAEPVSPSMAAPTTPTATSTLPCQLAGAAHVIAPKAQVRMGVETVASQGRVALGFVTGDKEGLAVALEPGSLTAVATAKQHSHEPIRRLVPQLGAGKGLVAIADAEHKGERVSGARTVVGDGTFVLGQAEGKLVWAAHATDAPHALWALEGEGPVEAVRAVQVEDGGHVVAFRQGAAIYLGAFGADKVPLGGLSRIAGLGPQIGSPALAASGGTAMVAWADRAATTDPWMLRVLRWRPGRAAGEPQAFTIPPGGLGEQAMSPGVTGLAGGRFLLAWTEGPVSSHQVRAQTLAASGEALGSPMTVSGEGINAGQGQPAILPDGRGLVVYMASPTGATAQVVATPVACPSSLP